MKVRAPVWVFSLALVPLGLGGVILEMQDIVQGHRSLGWTVVAGTVLSARTVPKVVYLSQPEIRYSYLMDEKPHVSTHIWPGGMVDFMPVFFPSAIQNLMDQFPPQMQVPVYVNPVRPEQSALIAGPQRAYLWMGISLFFLFVGIWSPLALERWAAKKKRLS